MAKTCKVTLNNEAFLANCGDLLLDSALMNGIDLPHDCRSGICGACRVRLVDGKVFGGQEHGDDMIHACQARVVSDLEIVSEPVPDQVSLPGRVAKLVRLAPDVIGVDVELPKPLHYLPGQYCKLQFRGLSARPIRWRDALILACCIFTSGGFPTGPSPPRSAGRSASAIASN
jgi:3-phenylpropionate/trans-cinnamate dioxygenase ferredoxin reductase subunit